MFFTLFASFSVLCLRVSSGAYLHWRADALDADTLLQNGKTAQALNSAFQKLNEGDACDVKVDSLACVKGNVATCTAGSSNTSAIWQITQQCSGSARCFALPSVRDKDQVAVLCTSERQASSIFHATGATGGIFGDPADDTCDNDSDENGTTGSESADSHCNSADDPTTSTSSILPSATDGPSETVASTVTVTATSTATTTITASITALGSPTVISSSIETLTISPEEASKIIADARSTAQPTSGI